LEFFVLIMFSEISGWEKKMKKISLIAISIILMLNVSVIAEVAVSLKQLTQVKGIRDNQLQGFGIVVGLEGTGDSNKSLFTIQSIVSMLKSHGINVNIKDIKVDNAAAVIVTTTLPPFGREGQKLDVVVSSIGDAENLQGGQLLQTPMLGADGNVYAVAQGQVTIGGFNVKSGGTKVTKNHPTAGKVVNGAIIEKTVEMEFVKDNKVELLLNNPDFMTVSKITEAINLWSNAKIATALDAGAVSIDIPEQYKNNPVLLLAQLEKISVVPSNKAKLIINTRTGTIVIGDGVKLSRAAIAHGNLSVVISESNDVVQPNALGSGETAKVTNTSVGVSETGGKVMMLNEGVTINDVVKALNSIGATPRDIISIIQALKEAGALYADIELL